MNSFLIVYKGELKKIISKKSVWIAMAIGLCFVILMGFTNLSSEGHISYVKNSRSVLSKIEGHEMDDAFFADFQNEVMEEIRNNTERYASIMAYDPGAAFMNGADAVGKKTIFDLIYNVVRDRSLVETVNGDAFYEKMRENIISDGKKLGASDDEISVWLTEYDKIEKPMKYYYAGGYNNVLDVLFFIGWVLFLNNAIALSGVYADEETYRTDAIILSAKKGRSMLCFAKIAAGVSVALVQGLIIIGSLFGVMFALFGVGGSAGMIQLIIPSSPWNITIGQMVLIFILLALVTTCFFALAIMLLSHITHSGVATMAICAAVLFAGLFTIPSKTGIIAKLWQLRPTMALYYGTFCNIYRYASMNNVQASVLIYCICTALFAVALFLSYKNSQVKSR